MHTVISVENLSKSYRLGSIGGATLREDLSRWWAKLRQKPDPTLKIGQEHHARLVGQEFWALQDVSFDVKEGEILGVIGRNGAGKSTLLKILSRVTAPTSGCVKIKGRIASLLEVGTGFHPELTGRENIFLNGAILGMTKSEIRSKFDEIVAFSEIEEFIDTPVKRYSSGMYVRLAFAVAAHLEPEILIVDEVLAVGDVQFQNKCLGKMSQVASGGRTVLFVSHNMAAVTALTKKILWLKNGEIEYHGPVAEGISSYMQASVDKRRTYTAAKTDSAGPCISRVWLDALEPTKPHISGQQFVVGVEISHIKPLKGTCLSFQIVNQMQQPVLHCWIYDPDTPICRNPGPSILKCTIPRLALNVGQYTLTVYLAEPPGGRHFETIEGICSFKVEVLGKQTLFGWRPEACSYLESFEWAQIT